MLRRLTILIAGVLALSSAAVANPPDYALTYSNEKITIDGRFSEAIWRTTRPFSNFHQRRPFLNAQPSVRTEVKVIASEKGLYFAVYCQDNLAANIRGRTKIRDTFELFNDDAITLKLDPQHDHRSTYGFAINATGAIMDYRGINEEEWVPEWDGVWKAAAKITNWGWHAEFFIPFSTLGIDPNDPPKRIGLNVSRDHPRLNATYDWALLAPPFSPIAASRYGHLDFTKAVISSLAQAQASSLSYGIVPYVLSGATQRYDGSGVNAEFNAGIDAFIAKGEKIKARLSINTDFAQVEVDNQVVNLSRFGLFFPEKREFFLRDMEVFRFGRFANLQGFGTRRIGLHKGQVVPVMHALKAVGRPDPHIRFGVIHALTRPTEDLPWTSNLVGRAIYEIGEGSNLGAIITHRQSLENPADYNLLLGIDGAWRSATTPLLLKAFAMTSINGSEVSEASSTQGGNNPVLATSPGVEVDFSWRGRVFRPALRYSFLSPGLRGDLSFLRRVGVQSAAAALVIEPRFESKGIEKLTIDASAYLTMPWTGERIWDYGAKIDTTLTWTKGYVANILAEFQSETIIDDFVIEDKVTIPAGHYQALELWAGASTPAVFPVSLSGSLTYRGYYGGHLYGFHSALRTRPHQSVSFDVAGDFRRIRFPNAVDNFNIALLSSRISVGITPKLGLYGFIQWNALSDIIRIQTRLRWRFKSGSDLFVVYQQDLNERGQPGFSSFLVKMSIRVP